MTAVTINCAILGLLVIIALGACKVAALADKKMEEIFKNHGKEKR